MDVLTYTDLFLCSDTTDKNEVTTYWNTPQGRDGFWCNVKEPSNLESENPPDTLGKR